MTETYPPRFNDAETSSFESPPTCKAAQGMSKISEERGSGFQTHLVRSY